MGMRFRQGQLGQIPKFNNSCEKSDRGEEEFYLEPSHRKQGIKKLANSTMKAREFNIISNRYHEGHDNKLS